MRSFSTDMFDQFTLHCIRQTSIHIVTIAVEDALQMSNVAESLLSDLPQCFWMLPLSVTLGECRRTCS
jgi:hypothetical protein